MGRMFHDMWRPANGAMSSAMGVSEYKDSDQETVVSIDVPGIDKENLKISLKGSLLTVEGKQEEHVEKRRPADREGEEGKLESDIRSVRQIKEQFSVDKDDYDLDKINVSMKNGVLTLRLPKAPKPEKEAVEERQLKISA